MGYGNVPHKRGDEPPEGVVVFHKHSNSLFKKTFEFDDKGKSYGH